MTTTETTDSTETTPELGTLTADDVRALIMADAVSFHFYEGKHRISATIGTTGDKTIFSATQQRLFDDTRNTGAGARARTIDVSGSVYGYGYGDQPSWAHDNSPRAACFAMVTSARYSSPWTTTAYLLRAGDVAHLAWVADNHTNVIEHGLHSDELHLRVRRGSRKLTFAVDWRVGPDNSARMIRRHG